MDTMPNVSRLTVGLSPTEALLWACAAIAVGFGLAMWVRRRHLGRLLSSANEMMTQLALYAARGQLTAEMLTRYDDVVFEYEVYRLLPLSRLLGQGLAPLPWSSGLSLQAYAPAAPAQGQQVPDAQQIAQQAW